MTGVPPVFARRWAVLSAARSATLCAVAAVALLVPAPGPALEGTALVTSGPWFETGDLISIDVATGESTVLVPDGGVFGPCFSPDGARVAYWRGGQIFTVAVDGGETVYVADTFNSEFRRQALTWTEDNLLYWSEMGPYIYRVDPSSGHREVVFVTDNRAIHMVGVSRDGRRAAATKPSQWHVWGYDLVDLVERDLNSGCQGTVSPDGHLFTRNGYYHRTATVERFSDLTVFARFSKPEAHGEFQMHRFAHGSGDHVLYTADRDHAFVHDLRSDEAYPLGRGSAWDFYPSPPEAPEPYLTPERLFFVRTAAGTSPTVAAVTLVPGGSDTHTHVEIELIYEGEVGWLLVSELEDAAGVAVSVVNEEGLVAGDHRARVSVQSDATVAPLEVEVTLTVLNEIPPLRVNCGADRDEVAGWVADDAFVRDGKDSPGVLEIDASGVGAPPPLEVFRSARESYLHSYLLPVPDGRYRLRLYLVSRSSAGSTVDYFAEGIPIAAALDVAAEAGGLNRALLLEREVLVTDGDGLEVVARGAALATECALEVLPYADTNQAPIVDAGPDLSAVVDTPLWLDGVVVDDGLPGGPVSVRWSQVGGSGEVALDDPASVNTTARFSVPGEYLLRLTASDSVLESFDDVEVAVTAEVVNEPPRVVAGADQTLPLGFPVWLEGDVSDDGLPSGSVAVRWSRQSGPGRVSFGDSGDAQTMAEVDRTGRYRLRLTADDGELTAWDEVDIDVIAPLEPRIEVLSPRGGEVWGVNTTQEIQWSATDVDDVTVRFSRDDGGTWEVIETSVDRSMPTWGSLPWRVPGPSSARCRVEVAGYFGETSATSPGTFEIVPSGVDGGDVDGGDVDGGDADADGDGGARGAAPGCGCGATGGGAAGLFVYLGLLVLVVRWRSWRALTPSLLAVALLSCRGGFDRSPTEPLPDPDGGALGLRISTEIVSTGLQPRSEHVAPLLPDGRVLLAGGDGTGDHGIAHAELFDPTDASITPLVGLVEARTNYDVVRLRSGRFLYVGGNKNNTLRASTEVFDPDPPAGPPSFSPGALLSLPRRSAPAVRLPDDRVLVAGGDDGTSPVSVVDILDPDGLTLLSTGTLATPRSDHALFALSDGKVLLAGGSVVGSDGTDSVEVYDPAGVTAAVYGTLTAARRDMATLQLGSDDFLLIGGFAEGVYFDEVERLRYDSGTGVVTAELVARLTAPRDDLGAELLPGNLAVIVGGAAEAAEDMDRVELLNPATGDISLAGRLAYPRISPGTTLLEDGSILVTGGHMVEGSDPVHLSAAERITF